MKERLYKNSITFSITDEMDKQLTDYVDTKKISKSEFLRTLVLNFFADQRIWVGQKLLNEQNTINEENSSNSIENIPW